MHETAGPRRLPLIAKHRNGNDGGDGVGEGELAVVVVRVSRGAIIIHLDQRGTITLVLCCFFLIHIYTYSTPTRHFYQTATHDGGK